MVQAKVRSIGSSVWAASEEAWRVNLWNYASHLSGGDWIPYAAHKYIADIVQEAVRKGGGRVIINIPPRHGKLCSDDTPVFTPEGWKTHGDLNPGDYVFGSNGEPTEILAVSQPGLANMRVTFANGESIDCHENHEWSVYEECSSRWKIVETRWLFLSGAAGCKTGLMVGVQPKVESAHPTRQGRVGILSVEMIPSPKPGKCVQVASADGLYLVGKKMILTHNSKLISHWLPTWFLDWYPKKRVLLSSYGDSLATDWSAMVRDEFRMNPKTWAKIRPDKENKADWGLCDGGGMRAAGVGGPIIGFGADLFLIDDPHKSRAEAFSQMRRQKVINWFGSDVYSRLEPGSTVVLIMQRWHEKDLTGYLLHEHEEDWTHINLPAIAEVDDPMCRPVGEALIPERYNIEDLEKIRAAIGSLTWAGMFQQRPAPAEGNIIMRDWFRHYMRLPADIKSTRISWDMSFKKEGKSWCVGQAWCQKGSSHYLLAQERGKWDFTTALKKVVAFHNQCTEDWGQVKETVIEEAANGIPIIQTLRGKLPRIKPIRASVSKLERLSNAAPSIECGDVHLPHKSIAPWVEDLIEELVTFPNGENDDQVDALSQYINEYKTRKVGALKLNLDIGMGSPEWRL